MSSVGTSGEESTKSKLREAFELKNVFFKEFFCMGVTDLLGHFRFLVTKKGKNQNFTKHPK